MKKKQLLLTLTAITTLATTAVVGVTLANANSFSTIATDGLVEHSLVMTTENTAVLTEAGEDCNYLYMETYTAHGNKFGVYDSEFDTYGAVYLNTEDALFEVSELYETIYLRLYICFDFNLDVEVGGDLAENITACMYYKLKTEDGWDKEPTFWDWSGLDAEDKHALFTFDLNINDIYGFKLISCNFTYTCSY